MLWRITLTFRDRDGNERRASICTKAATTVAALAAFAAGFEAAIAPLSNARIVAGSIVHTFTRSPGAYTPTSDATRKGLLLTRQGAGGGYASLLIPSPGRVLMWPSELPRVLQPAYVPVQLSAQIESLLGLAVLWDGRPYPQGEWLYADLSEAS